MGRNLRKKLVSVLVLVTVMLLSLNAKPFTVTSWGGAYGGTTDDNQLQPFAKATGNDVIMESYSGGTAQVKAQVESGNVTWDVVDMEGPDFFRACDEGLLEEFPVNELPNGADGTPWDKDFIDGAVTECGIATIVWSIVVAYNDNAYKGRKPKTLKDFFNVKKFPGKRGVRKSPQATLEWALMADGVSSKNVFKVLGTKRGVDRAFKKLDTIKKHIVWFDSWSLAPKMLADREVSMIQAANGRIFSAVLKENKPFSIIWDGQYYDFSYFAMPKGTENKKVAVDFIKFATQSRPLAKVANDVAYGLTRRSATPYVNKEVLPQLPGYSKNLKTAVLLDPAFWMDNKAELDERFNAWLLKK